MSSLSFHKSIPGGNRANPKRSIENGKEPKITSPAAWVCVALEANGLLVLHSAGTKKREALFDENGERIRGKDNKEAAQFALARIKLTDELTPTVSAASKDWTVAQVCEIYLADLTNTASPEWVTLCKSWLNEFCGYCGALTVQELKKKHLRTWLQKHKTWNNNTQRNVIACIKAAFNFCCKFDDLDVNPIAELSEAGGDGTGDFIQSGRGRANLRGDQ